MMGRFIESYLILPSPKMDDRSLMRKDLSFLFIEMVGQKQERSLLENLS